MTDTKKIAVIGLGYVGLPLAVHLAKHFPVIGLDIDAKRVEELKGGHDRTREIDRMQLCDTAMMFASDPVSITGSDIFIVTVPTPVDKNNQPDLSAVRGASRMVGALE